jgi:hypothetical protein
MQWSIKYLLLTYYGNMTGGLQILVFCCSFSPILSNHVLSAPFDGAYIGGG